MNRRAWLVLVPCLLSALVAGGCGGQPEEAPNVEVAPPPPDDFVDEISLAELLKKPRADLARQADEVQVKVNVLEEKLRLGEVRFGRLPDLSLPVVAPVFREAKYSEAFGFSVPPYLPEGVKDSGLALHLARHGDVEAARKLVEPGDAATLRQVNALAGKTNYPVEWTRLVGLLLHNAQFHLVSEEQYRAVRLISLHQQVAQVLDKQAAAGPLGAALLPRGHFVLKTLAAEWRGRDLPELAGPAEAGLKSWGKFPAPRLPFRPGKSSRAEVARLLGVPDAPGSRTLQTASVLRALDVLALPLPGGPETETVVTSFDPAGTLREVLVVYRARAVEHLQRPAQLAHLLEEATPRDQVKASPADGLSYRRYNLDGVIVEAALTRHSAAAGAVVRVHDGQPAGATDLPRAVGNVHLDRSFEQNRLHVAVHLQGNPLVLDTVEDLKQVANPVPNLKLLHTELHRAGQFDVTERVTLRWTADHKGHLSLGKLAAQLGAVAGTPHLAVVGGAGDGHLALTWQDERTRWTMKVPNKADAGPELEVADRTPAAQLPQYAARVRDRELQERKQRLNGGKPQQRLERVLLGVSLGGPRAEVAGRFKQDEQTAVLARPDTLAVRFARPAAQGVLWQELVTRFDAGQKVVEVRFRFRDASAKGGEVAKQLEALREAYGAPRELPAPWAGVWSNKGKPVLYRWQDDATVVTWQQDGGGVELTVRDCPVAHPDGVPLPPLALLDRGPKGCLLGEARADVLARNKGAKLTQPDGPWQLTPPAGSPYDVVLVWFTGDRVVRVVGRHAVAAAKVTGPDAAKMVADAWNAQFASYGWPRRQEVSAERLLESQGNHDDRTRVRVFWRAEQGGGSVFTEWTELAP
jgi:hypothetical protein